MPQINPIPSGPKLLAQRLSNRPATLPQMPDAWSASVIATPFGDSIAPLSNNTQLVVGRVETSTTGFESWMRVRVYLTQDLKYFDFLFICSNDPDVGFESNWYWIDSSVTGEVTEVHGPFKTTLQVPTPKFLEEQGAVWGNRYPLMCTDTRPDGIDCDHWVIPTAGTQTDHGSWYSVQRETGFIMRIFTMDSNNPIMLPLIGAFYIANFASLQPGVSDESKALLESVKARRTGAKYHYWNPLVTQQDVQRAFQYPLASSKCTLEDIQAVLPGFTSVIPSGTPLPAWTDKVYIEGWSLALDLIPYFTRVCYDYTGDERSREQATFIGWGQGSGMGSYLKRTDTCLNSSRTDLPYFEWDEASESWMLRFCGLPIQGTGLPYPDWISRSMGTIMGQIKGNPDFGLGPEECLNFISTEMPSPGGKLGIFWVWFLDNGRGVLFSEASYITPLSHTLQLIDYKIFLRDAPITDDLFSNPCDIGLAPLSSPASKMTGRSAKNIHPTRRS